MSYHGFGFLGMGQIIGVPMGVPDVASFATEKRQELVFFTDSAKLVMSSSLQPTMFVKDISSSTPETILGNVVFSPLEGPPAYETMRDFMELGYVVMLQTSVGANLLPLVVATKNAAVVGVKAVPGGGFGIVGGPSGIITAAQGIAGHGVPVTPPSNCGPGEIGIPPNCVKAPVPTCPPGSMGTPPNCVTPQGTCPPGTVGTPPSCSKPGPVRPPPLQAAIGVGGVVLGIGILAVIAYSLAKRSEATYAQR